MGRRIGGSTVSESRWHCIRIHILWWRWWIVRRKRWRVVSIGCVWRAQAIRCSRRRRWIVVRTISTCIMRITSRVSIVVPFALPLRSMSRIFATSLDTIATSSTFLLRFLPSLFLLFHRSSRGFACTCVLVQRTLVCVSKHLIVPIFRLVALRHRKCVATSRCSWFRRRRTTVAPTRRWCFKPKKSGREHIKAGCQQRQLSASRCQTRGVVYEEVCEHCMATMPCIV